MGLGHDGGMLFVVLDTNALFRDPWMTHDAASKLADLAAAGACEIVYPQVVIDELRRQRVESARGAHKDAAASVKQMCAAGSDVTQTANDLSAAHDRIEADIDGTFDAVLARNGVRAAPVPKVPTSELLRRDLGRRRPFLEIEQGKTKKSLGFRDVLIWESVLELLVGADLDDKVMFVTFDNGFLAEDKKSLHQDLMDDIDRVLIPQSRISWSRSIVEAIAIVEAQIPASPPVETMPPVEEAPEPKPTASRPSENPVDVAVNELKQMRSPVAKVDLVKAATGALYGLINEGVSEQLIYGGDYSYPSFVKFTVPEIEDAAIAGIDQTTEFSFMEDPASPDVIIATAGAVVTLEGGLYRGNWHSGDGEVSIIGELNNHYLEASAEVEVRVVVQLDIEGGSGIPIDVVLEDPRPAVGAADDVLDFAPAD